MLRDLAPARTLIATPQDQLTKSQRENAALRHQLDVLCRRLFGQKPEKVDPRDCNSPSRRSRSGRWRRGLPYQTLIASLLHKYAAGRLREV